MSSIRHCFRGMQCEELWHRELYNEQDFKMCVRSPSSVCSQISSFVRLPEGQILKQPQWAPHLITSLYTRENRSRKGTEEVRDMWPVTGSEKLRFRVPCLLIVFFLLYPFSSNNWGDNSVVKTQIWTALVRMLPAGLLISRVKKIRQKKIKRCWSNLLQVSLSGSCYATQQRGFRICRSWVGSCWIWLTWGVKGGEQQDLPLGPASVMEQACSRKFRFCRVCERPTSSAKIFR